MAFENEERKKPSTLPPIQENGDSGLQKLSLPLDFTFEERRDAVDIQYSKKAACLSCVELDLSELKPGSPLSKALREINQGLAESMFHFNINCKVHGQNLFASDLHFSLQGRKLVKSV